MSAAEHLAAEHLQEGDLSSALTALQADVRRNPADTKLRTFLFQLLAVEGDWNRARRQLDVLADMDPAAMPMVHTYREALACEALRIEVFAGNKSPLIFGEPEPWIATLLELLNVQNPVDRSVGLDRVLDLAPAMRGSINGEAFAWIADADARLGPILEVVMNNKYYWLPFHRLAKVVIEPPVDLRDAIWMPAYFTFANEGEAVGLIPTRYVGSHAAAEDSVRLSRQTLWHEVAEVQYEGLGQRVLATDIGDYPIMDIRELILERTL